jgi:hypothetical protein
MLNFSLLTSRTVPLLAIFLIISSTPVLAEEGSAGHVAPGGVATLIDAAPSRPGWVLETMYVNYDGSFDASKELPIGGQLSVGLDAKVDALVLGALYTVKNKFLGAHYSFGAFVPYTWMDVRGEVNQQNRRETVEGIGDITLIPLMLAWKENTLQYTASLAVYAPTGDYTAGALANLGLNYWTIDPTVGIAYNNPETGLNFGAYTGITFNTENSATNYDSGSMFHLEGSVQQLLPLGKGYMGLGLAAFFFQQVTGDSGAGARRDFKGKTAGIRPVINYILPAGSDNWVFEAKWLPELSTKNRLKGDFYWVKLVYQFQ